MNDTGLTKIIFQGVKFYWRTRNTIDVTMVDHAVQKLTEVILFDPSLGKEAPRVYINSMVLYSRLDHGEIQQQLSFAMRNSVPITEKFTESIVNKAKSDYILHRLVISEYDVESKKVVVTFQPCGTDFDGDDLICEKPELNFQPFRTVHYQQLMAGVVDQAIQSLNAEKAKLLTECDQAQALEKIAQESTKPLTGRQRWRIPIVFVKISHSKCLSAPDTKILRAVTQNIKCEEDALRMAAVLAPSPSKHRHGGFCSGGEASPAISAPPTAPTSRAVSFSGNHTAAAITISTTPVSTSSTHHHSQHLQQHTTPNHSPVHTTSVHTTPVHSTPSQSRLLRPTSASRLRAEGVQHHPPHYQEHISSVHSSVHTTTTPVHSTSVHAPVHSTPSHSRLLRPTSASRLRTEGVEHHPAPSCCNSRQTSFRQKESSVHSTAAEGHGNVHRTASKDEPVAAVSFYSKKKKAASKTPRAHKKNSQKSRSRAESQPILNRLRKLSFGLTGGKSPQESGEGCNAELDTSTASAASEDELSLRCHEDNEEDAMLSNTMQRVMAGLGALNNSLRASFGLSAGTGKCCSDKNAKCQQAAAAGASAASAPITEESVTIKSQTSQNAQEGVDRNAALIHVSKKPTADYSASTAAAGGTGARTSTLSRSDSNSNNEPRPIPSEKQSAAAFSMQKFFAGLVRWRSNEKVYVEEVMQE